MEAPRKKCHFLFTRLSLLLILIKYILVMLICITEDNNERRPRLLLSLIARLDAQRAKYIRDKMEDTQCYKRALDAQVRGQLLFQSSAVLQ